MNELQKLVEDMSFYKGRGVLVEGGADWLDLKADYGLGRIVHFRRVGSVVNVTSSGGRYRISKQFILGSEVNLLELCNEA